MKTTTPEAIWKTSIMMALSYINFIEQNLTLKELSTLVDGWMHWALINAPPGQLKDKTDKGLTVVLNNYGALCGKRGGQQRISQENIVKCIKGIE